MKTLKMRLVLLALIGIFLNACQDSQEGDITPVLQDNLEGKDVITENVIFNDVTYRLSHYYEADTNKVFVPNEDYLSLEREIGGDTDLKSIHVEWDENDVATYYLYNSAEELESAHFVPDAPMVGEFKNGRTASHTFTVVAFDHINYGGAVRFCAEISSWNFPDIGNSCSIICVKPKCKNNDISSLWMDNPTSSIKTSKFYADRNFTGTGDRKVLNFSANPNSVRFIPDLNLIPWVGNWRNRISSIRHGT